MDGRAGNVVLVGTRANAKGAVLVLPAESGKVETVPIASSAHLLHPQHVVEILSMQEKAFGDTGLLPPQQ